MADIMRNSFDVDFSAGTSILAKPAVRFPGLRSLKRPATGRDGDAKNARKPAGNGSGGLYGLDPGGDLLSHTAARAVPSAQRGLTSVFGMGTGVTPSV